MIITERTVARIAIVFAPIVAAALTLAVDGCATETTKAPRDTAGMRCATAKRTVVDPATGAIRTITRTVCVAR